MRFDEVANDATRCAPGLSPDSKCVAARLHIPESVSSVLFKMSLPTGPL